MGQDQTPDSAFGFDGNWREFAPIAFSNLLLNIVTLGIYRFWAVTRERRYLWAHSRFIDDRLEWSGTGTELFIGFLAAALLFLPLLALYIGMQILRLLEYRLLVWMIGIALGMFFLGLTGFARFRALRYRLSRTWWRGIRGGSDEQGFRYSVSALWKGVAGTVFLFFLTPWSMITLWNERWDKMSFGSQQFISSAEVEPLYRRFMFCYIPVVILFFLRIFLAFSGTIAPKTLTNVWLSIYLTALLIPLVLVFYYAVFFREAVGGLMLDNLEFRFTASAWDWIKLLFGSAALVIGTLGIGWVFLGYRNWSFFIRHLEANGDIDVDALTQSTTRAPRQGEGLLEAFDIGAL